MEQLSGEAVEIEQELDLPKPNVEDLPGIIFSLIFANGRPLPAERIKEITQCTDDEFNEAAEEIRSRLREANLGVELRDVASAYQIRSRITYAPYLKQLKASKPKKLSNQAMETLAVVAYRQPIVKSDIESIRGVDATPTLKTLIDRRLIKIVGHQSSVGQPALYGTTQEFLELFGLSSLSELPTLRDLEALERDPGENPIEES